MPYGMMGFGWIFQLIILGTLILIFWWLLRGQGYGYTSKDTPEEIVKRRYAAGEIKKKEFEQLLKDLK